MVLKEISVNKVVKNLFLDNLEPSLRTLVKMDLGFWFALAFPLYNYSSQHHLWCSVKSKAYRLGYYDPAHGRVDKPKPSSLYPFFFHLYYSLELMKDGEMVVYEAAKVMMKYSITLKLEP